MFRELRDQNVFSLCGADDVVVELLVDVAGGLCAFSGKKRVQVLHTFGIVLVKSVVSWMEHMVVCTVTHANRQFCLHGVGSSCKRRPLHRGSRISS